MDSNHTAVLLQKYLLFRFDYKIGQKFGNRGCISLPAHTIDFQKDHFLHGTQNFKAFSAALRL